MEFELDFSLPAHRDLKGLGKSPRLAVRQLIDCLRAMYLEGVVLPQEEEFIIEDNLSFVVYTEGRRITVRRVLTINQDENNTPEE